MQFTEFLLWTFHNVEDLIFFLFQNLMSHMVTRRSHVSTLVDLHIHVCLFHANQVAGIFADSKDHRKLQHFVICIQDKYFR